jgi:hypothetical protein
MWNKSHSGMRCIDLSRLKTRYTGTPGTINVMVACSVMWLRQQHATIAKRLHL